MHVAAIAGDRLVIESRPDPVAGPGEVLVSVAAAAINAADLMQRRGLYPAPFGVTPDVPGLELAGTVVAVGAGVDARWLDRRVCAIVSGGAQATMCVVPVGQLIDIPVHVDHLEASGFAEAFVTAHDALVSQGCLQPGERVLISGASGGVGTAAVQVAAHLAVTVVAVTRHVDHGPDLLTLGATEVVTLETLNEVLPVDVIIELVGAAHLEQAFPLLRRRGRVVVIGVGAGASVRLDLLHLMRMRALVTGSTLRARTLEQKAAAVEAARRDLDGLWRDHSLRVPIAEVFNFAAIERAYEAFAAPGKFGKIVVQVDQQ